ncbi:thioesterase family protein [Fusarium oxysporum f. sp. phaseoli]
MLRALRTQPVLSSIRMMFSSSQPGTTTIASLVVKSSDLASAISLDTQDAFPQVFATARLVALMEIASARALKPLLQPGQLSVGVSINMTHSAPTPLDAEVTAEATYRGREEKLHVFDVVARDGGGEVGKAVHRRAIINAERLEQGAKKRVEAIQGLK